jgi:hypothetical protein
MELEEVHKERTAIMTESISSRVEAFNNITRDNTGKVASILNQVTAPTLRAQDNTPFTWNEQIVDSSRQFCTRGFPEEDRLKLNTMQSLFDSFLEMRLGWKNNLQIFSMIILVENQGVCVLYNDSEFGYQRFIELDQLPRSSFTHEVFYLDDYSQFTDNLNMYSFLGGVANGGK